MQVNDPIFGAKNYFWCSCGMSKNQPFCDRSHAGSDFKPIKFSLDTKVKSMYVCGCKLSSQAPFCDGITCQKLLKGEEFELQEDMLYLQEEHNNMTESEEEHQEDHQEVEAAEAQP